MSTQSKLTHDFSSSSSSEEERHPALDLQPIRHRFGRRMNSTVSASSGSQLSNRAVAGGGRRDGNLDQENALGSASSVSVGHSLSSQMDESERTDNTVSGFTSRGSGSGLRSSSLSIVGSACDVSVSPPVTYSSANANGDDASTELSLKLSQSIEARIARLEQQENCFFAEREEILRYSVSKAEDQMKKVALTERNLAQRDKSLEAKEVTLRLREDELEAKLAAFEKALEVQNKALGVKIRESENIIANREKKVANREKKVANREKRVVDSEKRASTLEKKAAEAMKTAREREVKLGEYQEETDLIFKMIGERERGHMKVEWDLTAREKQIEESKSELRLREEELIRKEEDVRKQKEAAAEMLRSERDKMESQWKEKLQKQNDLQTNRIRKAENNLKSREDKVWSMREMVQNFTQNLSKCKTSNLNPLRK